MCRASQLKVFLEGMNESALFDKVDDAKRRLRGARAAAWLAGDSYRVMGANPVGNTAFVAAVKSSMKGEASVKLRQVAFVSFKVGVCERLQHNLQFTMFFLQHAEL